jgi:hypothetical protein
MGDLLRSDADNGDASVGGEQDEREKGVTDKEGSTATGPPEALPSHVFWMAVLAAAAAAVIAIPLMSLWKE